MKKSILFIFIVLFTVCCKKEKDNLSDKYSLIGIWEWTRTDGGMAYHIHFSPNTIGYTIRLEFINDSQIAIYKDEVEIFNGTYAISKEESIYSNESEDYIRIDDNYSVEGVVLNGIVYIKDTSIVILDNNYDGIGSVFIKN